MKFKQESLSNDTPANDNYDLILKNMLITNPEAFQSYVGNRLWGLNNNAKRKISAGKLTQIIEKYKLTTKIPKKLEERIRSGDDQSNTEFYVFDYTNFNYFIHFLDENNQLMLIKKAPKSTEEYSFANVLSKPNNTELEQTTTTTTTTTTKMTMTTQPPKN